MGKIFDNIVQTIGNTPIVRLNKLVSDIDADVLVKMETFNPLSSVKDRIGVSMIEAAEEKGLLKEGSVIIEPTSGNTGIALAFVAASKGYKLILTMPDTMSVERRKLLKILGAELVLTDGSQGMKGAINKAEELLKEYPHSFMPQQFENPSNPDAHRHTTAREILQDTEGQVDVFVAGVGTGGTITGVGSILKEHIPSVKIMAVEPVESAVLSGDVPGTHKIQGIGAGFIPKVLDQELIDGIVKVSHEDAGIISRRLAREEGILAGISAGANVYAALELAKTPEFKGKTILTIICDTAERYLSTWLFDKV